MSRTWRLALVTLTCAVHPLESQQAKSTQPTPTKVVFVCEHGSVKSLVALEHFQRLARAAGLRVEASSRGTHPDSIVPSVVRAGLSADGFDVTAFHPRLFTPTDLESTTLIVALDADVDPVVQGRVQISRWDSLPSVTANYSRGRDALLERVKRLVDSLSKAQKR